MKIDKSVQITSIIVVGVLICVAIIVASFNSVVNPENTVNSYGEATIDIVPDLVTVYFTVQTSGEDSATIQTENNEIVDKLISNIVAQGFEEKDIQTQNFYIGPKYIYTNGKQIQDGYEATHYLKVELSTDDSSKIGKIVDAGVNAGAAVSYINFELSQKKQNEAKAQAIEMAAQDARIKAQALAKGLGYEVGKLVSVSNSDFGYSPWNIYSSREGSAMSVDDEELQKAVASTSIQPGEQTVRASVTAVFKIK